MKVEQASDKSRMTVETAERVLELVHDLGECRDARQILVASARHFRVLFGDFLVATLVADDPRTGHWRALSLENPYLPSWGGVTPRDIPKDTDLDAITHHLGRDVTGRVRNDYALNQALIQSHEPFFAVDNVLSVHLAAMTNAPCRCFMGASWKRPTTEHYPWLILGFATGEDADESKLGLFTTAVETTSRMASYPSMVHYVQRQERVSHSIRRNIVHDLKTPITVIKGYAETLQHQEVLEDEEMSREFIDAIVDSCDRLLADIKDIIEPVEGAYVPRLSEFDLAQLVSKTIMAERHTERSRHHEILLAGADAPVIVTADMRKVRRVLENLISNAIKYSPGVGNKVYVTLQANAEVAKITVRDEGIGMTADQLEKAMAGGGRVVDQSLGIEGSGFGLGSAQLVLTAHRGKLEADSAPGQGTSFTATIPRTQVDEEEDAPGQE